MTRLQAAEYSECPERPRPTLAEDHEPPAEANLLSEEDRNLPPADLNDTVSQVSAVVGELRSQLTQLIRINGSLEKDLENAQERIRFSAKEREQLSLRIQDLERLMLSGDSLRSEIDQLHRERDALSEKVEDLSQSLADSQGRVSELSAVLDHFREERNDASEEASCLESQFSRAMKVIAELRRELAGGRQSESALQASAAGLEAELEHAKEQRDAYRLELQEARSTLEEVRRSLLETQFGTR